MKDKNLLLRQLPAVDRILSAPAMQALAATCPHVLLVEAAQETVAELRRAILDGGATPELTIDAVAEQAARRAEAKQEPSLRPVLNATGTLLHTNLGRAPLSEAALAAITAISRSYSNLELDLTTGKRGHRFSHVEELLCRLTGAEAAAVVNNNAGAVLLALTALAKGKEAIVSRGEMIEIGGAFRIPEVMEAGGVRLREVGTTNKTHLKDYAGAINDETGLLLKVHTSNYRIVGFTEEVPAAAMVELAHGHGLPVMEDLGSGMLMDLTPFGLPREPTVRDAVATGIDVVTFSGDKLLGGPQAGILVGTRAALDKIRHHPLARALRIDKLTLAALEATLAAYLDERRALAELPVLRMLNMSAADVEERSRAFAEKLGPALGAAAEIAVIEEPSAIGGGALPLTELPGFAVALTPQWISVDTLANRLRQGKPPVIGRVQDNRLLLNLRTILPDEEPRLIDALRAALLS